MIRNACSSPADQLFNIMSNFRRGKPKKQKGDSMGHRSELDPEPDPSKSSPAGHKKRQKKPWVITGDDDFGVFLGRDGGRRCYGKYITEHRAMQAMEHMKKQDASMKKILRKWRDREYRIEYRGNDE